MTRSFRYLSRTRRSRMDGGFTLIELVSTIVIVAILAAVAVPTFSNLGNSRSAAAAKQLLSDVTFARQRAIATGVPTWIAFNTTSETWTLSVEDPANPGRANASVLVDPVDGNQFVEVLGVDRFLGVELVSAGFNGNPEVGFDWLGRPLDQSEALLTVDGTVTITGGYTLTVYAESGHIVLATP